MTENCSCNLIGRQEKEMFEGDVQRSVLSWYWEQLRQHRARMAREAIMLFQLVMKARACQMYEEDCWDES